MDLPIDMRETLVEELDDFLEAVSDDPDPEPVAAYVIELLEGWADELGQDDLIFDMESEAQLETSLQETVEEEMTSNDEFEFTGEEILSMLERLAEITWQESEGDEAGDDEEEEEEEEDLEP